MHRRRQEVRQRLVRTYHNHQHLSDDHEFVCSGILSVTLYMEWDKFKMAQKFLQRANAIHPEDSDDMRGRIEALALQDVYYDCYMSSFSRDELLKRLAEIISGDIEMPEEEEIDEDRYRETYTKEARKIKESVEKQ